MSSRTVRLVSLICLISLASLTAHAEPISYSGGSANVLSIGNQLAGGQYDQLHLSPISGTIDASGYYSLNVASFDVGSNTFSPSQYSASGSITEDVTVDGIVDSVTIPYTATINDRSVTYWSCGW